jgi:hypothetical protein
MSFVKSVSIVTVTVLSLTKGAIDPGWEAAVPLYPWWVYPGLHRACDGDGDGLP